MTNMCHVTEHSSFDRDILEALHKVGFRTNLGFKDSGFAFLAVTRGGGYYLGLSSSIYDISLEMGMVLIQ